MPAVAGAGAGGEGDVVVVRRLPRRREVIGVAHLAKRGAYTGVKLKRYV